MMKMKTLMSLKGRNCYYCTIVTRLHHESGKLSKLATRDHMVPKCKGGSNHIDNIVISCTTCNTLKGHTSVEEFLNSDKLKNRIIQIQNGGKENKLDTEKYRKLKETVANIQRERQAKRISLETGQSVEELLEKWQKRAS